MAGKGLREINDLSFDDLMEEGGTVLLEMGAAWCAPCRLLDPLLAQ